MKTMSRVAALLMVGAMAVGLGGCMHAEDPLVPYIQRTAKNTLDSGNAMEANAAIHTIDPWPRASANRRLPTDGQRMAESYERYRDVNKTPPRPTINPVIIGTGVGSFSSSGSGGAK